MIYGAGYITGIRFPIVEERMEYKRRLPPRGIFWIVEVYIVSTNEKSSLPAVVLVANCDDPEPNMAEPLERLGRCIFVNTVCEISYLSHYQPG